MITWDYSGFATRTLAFTKSVDQSFFSALSSWLSDVCLLHFRGEAGSQCRTLPAKSCKVTVTANHGPKGRVLYACSFSAVK